APEHERTITGHGSLPRSTNPSRATYTPTSRGYTIPQSSRGSFRSQASPVVELRGTRLRLNLAGAGWRCGNWERTLVAELGYRAKLGTAACAFASDLEPQIPRRTWRHPGSHGRTRSTSSGELLRDFCGAGWGADLNEEAMRLAELALTAGFVAPQSC